MLKTNWLRCIWAICIMTGKSIHPCFERLAEETADAMNRIQLPVAWLARSLPDLLADYQRVHRRSCEQSYHHLELRYALLTTPAMLKSEAS